MAAGSVHAMSLFRTVLFLIVTFLCTRVTALASTGTIPWGGNNTRAGYRDSAVVGSAQFGLLFQVQLLGNLRISYTRRLLSTP
jgi:hypothetical protein